jgi:indolepyruvate decarboxylase
MPKTTTIGKYLVTRLEQAGLKHIFGIPGDYVLGFYDLLVDSKIDVIGTCTEIGAGFAADAYARVNRVGALCVTYCVGGFNALNAVAGAYAEKSPLIMISGAPGMAERSRSPLLHHAVKDFNTQKKVFEQVTIGAFALEDAHTAPDQIDEAFALCARHKRPVYIELPRDMVHKECRAPGPIQWLKTTIDRAAMSEAIDEAEQMLRKAKKPVILAGVEIHRFSYQEQLLKLVEKAGYPVAATLLGKSVISEVHPQYLGVYEGAMGKENVRKAVETADAVLILGAFMTDINLGIYTANLDESRTINATSERITIKRHFYEDVSLKQFITGLTAKLPKRTRVKIDHPPPKPFKPRKSKAITVRRFFERMNEYLDEQSVVICDIGDSLFGGSDLTIHRRTEFLSPAYYTSMGFAVPAAIGAQINRRDLRPIVFVGDGAFQMTGHEVSTIARYGLNPIVFVLNNKGYTTERFINEGPYNDVQEWAYHLFPQIVRNGWGCEVRTEGELEDALVQAKAYRTSFSIINVHLEKMDKSYALERLGKRLGQRAKG